MRTLHEVSPAIERALTPSEYCQAGVGLANLAKGVSGMYRTITLYAFDLTVLGRTG